MQIANFVGGVRGRCDVCRSSDSALRVRAAGASIFSMFHERLQVDLSFLRDLLALHDMDVFSRYALLLPARSRNPRGVWDAFRGAPEKCGNPREVWDWRVRPIGVFPLRATFVRSGESNSNFEVVVRFPGPLSVAMVLRDDFLLV